MEILVCQFDAELQLLRHQKLRLDWQLKQADLCQLTLYQEVLLLKEFEKREDKLQETIDECIKEENSITVGLRLSTVFFFISCVLVFLQAAFGFNSFTVASLKHEMDR